MFFVISFLIFFDVFGQKDTVGSPKPKLETEKSSRDRKVLELNKTLEFWKVELVDSNTLRFVDDEKPQKSKKKTNDAPITKPPSSIYRIRIDSTTRIDANFLFRIYEYWIPLESIPRIRLKEIADSLLAAEEPLKDLINKKKFLRGSAFAEFLKLETETQIIVGEMLKVVRKITKFKTNRVRILVRGGADGEIGYWDKLLHSSYLYTNFAIFPASCLQTTPNCGTYIAFPNPFLVGAKYINDKLPNLRGNFICQEIIMPLIDDKSKEKISVHVLGNVPFSITGRPGMRLAEIFIQIYEN